MTTSRYHHPLQTRLSILEVVLLSYVHHKTGSPWAKTVRDSIRKYVEDAAYFDVEDFKRFAMKEFKKTLENPEMESQLKHAVDRFLSGNIRDTSLYDESFQLNGE